MLMMVAQVCGLKTGEFIHTFGDLHLYSNHRSGQASACRAKGAAHDGDQPGCEDINSFQYGDFELQNYDPHPSIKAPIAV